MKSFWIDVWVKTDDTQQVCGDKFENGRIKKKQQQQQKNKTKTKTNNEIGYF